MPPLYDDVADALVLTQDGAEHTVDLILTGATEETGENAAIGWGPSVWATFDLSAFPPGDVDITFEIETISGSFQPLLEVYAVDPSFDPNSPSPWSGIYTVNSEWRIPYPSPSGTHPPAKTMTFQGGTSVTNPSNYDSADGKFYVLVADWDWDGVTPPTGTIRVIYTADAVPTPPTNDTCATAQAITGQSGQVDVDNRLAAYETPDPIEVATGDTGSGSLYYRWTAPQDGYVRFHIDNPGDATADDVFVGIFEGACGALTQLPPAYPDFTIANDRTVETFLGINSLGFVGGFVESGVEYTIEVATAPGSEGTFRLRWDMWTLTYYDDIDTSQRSASGVQDAPSDIVGDAISDGLDADGETYCQDAAGNHFVAWRDSTVGIRAARWDADGSNKTEHGPFNETSSPGSRDIFARAPRLASDGENVWLVYLASSDRPAQDGDGNPSTWDPLRLEFMIWDGADFTSIGFLDAATFNTGGGVLGGSYNGLAFEPRAFATPLQPGLCFITWAEGGALTTTLTPDGSGVPFFSERAIVFAIDAAGVQAWLWEIASSTVSRVDYDANPGKVDDPCATGFIRPVADAETVLVFYGPPEDINIVSRVAATELRAYTADVGALTLAQTITPGDSNVSGSTSLTAFGISEEAWTDPVDATVIYYVAILWFTAAANSWRVHRIPVDASSGFSFFDDDEAAAEADISSSTDPGCEKLFPEANNVWWFGRGHVVRYFDRRCEIGWRNTWASAPSGGIGPPFGLEDQPDNQVISIGLVKDGDDIWYGGRALLDFPTDADFHAGVLKSRICRDCQLCEITAAVFGVVSLWGLSIPHSKGGERVVTINPLPDR